MNNAADVLEAVERRALGATLPDNFKPLWGKLSKFADKTAHMRKQIGKSVLSEKDYKHWVHTLSQAEREKLQGSLYDTIFKVFSTQTPSDKHRRILKFVALGNPDSHFVDTAVRRKLLPVSMKGVSKEELGDMFENTIRDVADLRDVADMYNIKVDLRDRKYLKTGQGLAGGYWNTDTNTYVVATGARTKSWLSTTAHELGHSVHGRVGGWAAQKQYPIEGKLVTDALSKGINKTLMPKKNWALLESKTALLSTEAKQKIRNYLHITPRTIAKKKHYYNKPNELFAQYMEVWKLDKSKAKEISPKLFKVTNDILDSTPSFRKAKEFFNRQIGRAGDATYSGENVFKDPKTKELFIGQQATIKEINSSVGEARVLKKWLADGRFRVDDIDRTVPEFVDDVTKEVYENPFMSVDIPYTAYVMNRRLARENGGLLFRHMAGNLGSEEAIDGWVKGTGELKHLYFNPKVAEQIEMVNKAFIGEESARGFLKTFDEVQNYWKLQTLGIFPAYHFRNIIGNVWNNYLANVKVKYYKDALMFQNGKLKKSIAGIPPKQLKSMIEFFGIESHGLMGAELPSMMPSMGKKSLGQRAAKASAVPAQVGMEKVGRPIEANARIAHFFGRLDEGYSPRDAAMSVKKYLFDYAELTPFEKNVMKRIMPFYTWSRKNIPLQLEALTRNTGRPMLLEKARQETYKAVGEPNKAFMPDWIRERMPFFLGKEKNEYSFFPLENWIPFADIMKVSPARAKDIVGELLSPIIKIPIELSTNKVYYFDQPIQNYMGEREEFLRKDMPAWVAYLGRQVRILNEVNRMVGYRTKSPTAPPEPTVIQKTARALTGVKAYRYDLNKAIYSKKLDILDEIKKLKIGLSRAESYGRKEEARRIRKTLEGIEQQVNRLPQTKR